EVNLGVSDWQYELALNTGAIPLEPLLSTFAVEKNREIHGNVIANGKIKGVGVSGTNFQRSLTGQAVLLLTNANVQISSPKMRGAVLMPIAAILGAPELLSSPV